jgi:hypothetical protein
MIMLDASEFSGSNYFSAENIPPNTRIEFTVTSAFIEEFRRNDLASERKLVLGTDYQAMKLVMNKTRNKIAIKAWGPNAHNWVGKIAAVFRDYTMFAGKRTQCVGFEPTVTNALATPQAPRGQLAAPQFRRVQSAAPAQAPEPVKAPTPSVVVRSEILPPPHEVEPDGHDPADETPS